MEPPMQRATLLLHGVLFPLLITLCYASAQTPPGPSTDRLALLSFKSLLKDPNGALGSWNSTGSTHHCQWYGVSCNSTNNPERVTSLELEALSLSGTISPALSNLTSLLKLHLPNNTLHGSIPAELGNLQTLLNLNLSVNSLEGEIPASLGGCTHLRGLSLRNNRLQGTVPVNLTRCLNLQILSLRNNRLQGEIPPELGGLPSLRILYLHYNRLTGAIPPSLGNLTSLEQLRLSYNSLGGAVPPELHGIRRLQILDLLFNQLSGEVPHVLYNFSDVYGLGFGGNLLKGTLPRDLGVHLPKLKYLFLYNNQFDGPIPTSISNASELQGLQLSNNSFSGTVPPTLGMIPALTQLHLGGNRFVARNPHDWRFMDSLTNCTELEEIDLADNFFGGSFPISVSNLSTSMKYLRMKNNSISGEIPREIAGLHNLQVFGVDTNLLTGAIPETIGELANLGVLSLYNNSLSGEIPESIGNVSSVVELYLSLNRFTGSIPASFERLLRLEALDLSHNKLTGVIPSGLFKISSLTVYLNISGNSLGGPLPNEVGSSTNVQTLQLSDNNLSGRIPAALGECLLLDYLHLGGNSFQGGIPQSLSNLKGLQTLNLSHNRLSGQIPSFLAKLPSLKHLNLSFNDLEGEVPTEGVFANGSSISVVGNRKLCGGVPELQLDPCDFGGGNDGRKHLALIIVLIVIAVAVGCLVPVTCISRRCPPAKNPQKKIGLPLPSLMLRNSHVSYKELCKATDGFASANLIGSGSYGSVYRGSLVRFKKMVAVKVLDCQQQGALSGFMAECRVLRNIRHRNLVRVLTSCSTVDGIGNDFKALVYEYMPNGSLDSWLHGGGRFLSLRERVGIANDVALALDYLHHQGQVPVVHSDLKPSNILLDEDMTAHVGDFGLARFLKKNTSVEIGRTDTVAIKGTVGYIAPEYGMGSPISTQGDVYSFGILLLEMLIGRRPTDEEFGDGINLHIYASKSYPENVRAIVDPRLLEDGYHRIIPKEQYECVSLMVGVGLACSREAAGERINTRQVLQQLVVIRDILGKK